MSGSQCIVRVLRTLRSDDERAAREANPAASRVHAGMGAVIGERHVLTCAHVVAAAVGKMDDWMDKEEPPDAELEIEFPYAVAVDDLRPLRKARVAPGGWRARAARQIQRDLPDDVAVLEIIDGELPQGAAIGILGQDPQVGDDLYGIGFDKAGVYGPISGVAGGPAPDNRIFLRVERTDDMLEPGYSGAPLINASGLIAGMATTVRKKMTAAMIGAEDLRRAWPQAPRAATVKDSHATVSEEVREAGLGLPDKLLGRLHAYDRERPYGRIERATGGAPPAIVALFAATPADLPAKFRESCEFGLWKGRTSETVADLAGVVGPLRNVIDWPRGGRLEEDIDDLRYQLGGRLQAPAADDDCLRDWLDRGLRHRVVYSQIPAAWLGYRPGLMARLMGRPGEVQRALLAEWSRQLAALAAGGLGYPLIHLVCVEFPAPPAGAEDPDAWTAAEFAGVTEGLPPAVLRLGALDRLNAPLLGEWLKEAAAVAGAQAELLETRLHRSIDFSTSPRLEHLRAWAETLSGIATP